jgi:hypothetical protein
MDHYFQIEQRGTADEPMLEGLHQGVIQDSRISGSGHAHCTFICRMLDDELAAAQRVCEAVAQTGFSSDSWAAIATAADAWSEYQRHCDKIHALALSVGISDGQWAALMGGVA